MYTPLITVTAFEPYCRKICEQRGVNSNYFLQKIKIGSLPITEEQFECKLDDLIYKAFMDEAQHDEMYAGVVIEEFI